MELFKEMFANPDVFEQYPCPICLQMLFDPVSDNCPKHSHDFCRLCLEGWRNMRNSCPISKLPFTGAVTDNKALREKLMGEKIKCQQFQKSCAWTGTLGQLEAHLKDCEFMVRVLTTKMVKAKGGKGSQLVDDSSLMFVNSTKVELAKIKMEFSKRISNWGWAGDFNCLSSIQFFYRRQLNGEWIQYAGRRLGGAARDFREANIDHSEEITFPHGERLTKIVVYHGGDFFPAIGFSTNLHPEEKKYGFINLAKQPEVIEVPEDCEVVGSAGYFGWVVDELGFTFCKFPANTQ